MKAEMSTLFSVLSILFILILLLILLSRLGSVFVWLSLLNFLDLITDSFPEGLTGVVKVEDQEEGAGQDELEWTGQILDTV